MPNIASRVVQCTKSAGNGVVSFFEEVIQWRRPVLGSFYVMLTNTAFWASVFYLDKYQQLSCLIGIVIVLFISCVFSTAVVTAAGVVTNAQDSYRKWFSPSEDGNLAERGSVASSVVKTFGVVAFTLESFFLPMINFTTSLLSQRPASIMLIATSSTAARYLHDEQHDKACWSAYLTVLIMILVPPWRYNGVTDQIVTNVSMVYETIRQWLHQHVFSPLVGLILYLFSIIRYCVCGHWIPPLVARMVGIYRGIVDFVHAWFLDPVARLLAYLKSQVIYWACGHWIPPLIEYLKEKKRGMVEWIRVRVVDPIVAVYQSFRDFCIYWFGGYFARILQKTRLKPCPYFEVSPKYVHSIKPFSLCMTHHNPFLVQTLDFYTVAQLTSIRSRCSEAACVANDDNCSKSLSTCASLVIQG